MVWGYQHALVGTLILILLPTYLGLSVSVMIGLPAIAFAVLSLLALTAWHQYRKYLWLILSALALCLSVFTKIFPAFWYLFLSWASWLMNIDAWVVQEPGDKRFVPPYFG